VTSTPLPLAITGSPNNEAIVADGVAFVSARILVPAGSVSAFARDAIKATANTAEKISFVLVFMSLFDWFGFGSVQSRSQRYHFYVADVSVFL
jgi:hypothetical protein